MKNGWIKLHKKIIDNEIFRHDRTAWHVFETLLILADTKTGKWSGGMHILSDLCNLNRNTLYKAIKRLEKDKMVNTSVNSRYTVYNICNWSDYQTGGKHLGKLPVNAEETPSNTIKRTKNKELRTMTTSYGKPEINEMFDYWKQSTGIEISSQTQANRRACNNLLKKHGKENLMRLIQGVAVAQGDQYAPRIANFVQLQSKVDDLILWGKKNNKVGKVVKI